jgi:transcriptional regulator with XRE-family HTH domain
MTLGENIERLRVEGGHGNAAEFARRIGVSPGTLGDWEKGRYKNLRLDNLLLLAKNIPCTMDELVIGIDPDYEAWLATQADSVWKKRAAREAAYMAATREALAHKVGEIAGHLGELTAIISRLPGGQAPVARRGESESPQDGRRRGRRPHRPRSPQSPQD